MFWFKTGVLSDKEIKRLLGKKIFIWPFTIGKLKGSTYNLTASMVARSAYSKKVLINSDGDIEIPSGDTALIQTEESIYVDKDICGTYHSKVKLVSKGLSHIGTTLDPYYFGTSLIAVHNHSKEAQKIKVGDTFVSIMFQKMSSSSKVLHDNHPFRRDVINVIEEKEGFEYKFDEIVQNSILKKISLWEEEPWRSNKESLIEQVGNYVRKEESRHKIKYIHFMFNIIFPLCIISTLVWGIYSKWFDERTMPFIGAALAATYVVCSGIGKAIENLIKGEW